MAELYDFTDRDGDGLRVTHDGSNGYVAVSKETGPAAVYAPTGSDAVALARAILAAAGDTGHEVVSADNQRLIRTLYQQRADLRARIRDVEAVAESMRERAARTVMSYTDGLDDLAGEVEDLPLLPDEPARTPLTADTDA